METIKTLLGMAGEDFVQPRRGWGNYRYSSKDLGRDVANLTKIFFVECEPAGVNVNSSNLEVLNHHGARSNEPAAVLQVLKILERFGLRISDTTRRWIELIAANDCGAYNGMEGFGATQEEIQRVRAFTRKAQNVTSRHESDARKAVNGATTIDGVLVLKPEEFPDVFLKNVCVLDILYEAGRHNEPYLIAVSGNFHFSGDGEACARLQKKFGGWAGGSGFGQKGDNRAFWGCNAVLDYRCILDVINS
jgi:hypothetical protein